MPFTTVTGLIVTFHGAQEGPAKRRDGCKGPAQESVCTPVMDHEWRGPPEPSDFHRIKLQPYSSNVPYLHSQPQTYHPLMSHNHDPGCPAWMEPLLEAFRHSPTLSVVPPSVFPQLTPYYRASHVGFCNKCGRRKSRI